MDLNHIFPEKQPPEGGLSILRTKIRTKDNRNRKPILAWTLASATALFLAILAINSNRPRTAPAPILSPIDLAALAQTPPTDQNPQGLDGEAFVKLNETQNAVYYRIIKN